MTLHTSAVQNALQSLRCFCSKRACKTFLQRLCQLRFCCIIEPVDTLDHRLDGIIGDTTAMGDSFLHQLLHAGENLSFHLVCYTLDSSIGKGGSGCSCGSARAQLHCSGNMFGTKHVCSGQCGILHEVARDLLEAFSVISHKRILGAGSNHTAGCDDGIETGSTTKWRGNECAGSNDTRGNCFGSRFLRLFKRLYSLLYGFLVLLQLFG